MVVTIGFFDGVHIGHRRVLRTLAEKGGDVAAITFWPHPRAVLQQDARDLCLLTSIEEKTELINACGIQDLRKMAFTRDFASMPAERFVKEVLIGQMSCTGLVLGYDNRLGSDGMSTLELSEMCMKMGLQVDIVPPCVVDGTNVSSTRIRNAILSGDAELAATMLGYRYAIPGVVVPGNRLGHTIGFPTANIQPVFPLKAIPENGVYASEITVGDKRYKGMTNIGIRPTVGDSAGRVIETNIFDFDEDIYGLEIKVGFVKKIRNEQKFPSLEDLKKQLETDKHRCYGCY